jgi:aerobic carbon-monoxide dehydrogenase medium subunit
MSLIVTNTSRHFHLTMSTVPADDLNSDVHASAGYRAHLVGVIAKRAVEQALTG